MNVVGIMLAQQHGGTASETEHPLILCPPSTQQAAKSPWALASKKAFADVTRKQESFPKLKKGEKLYALVCSHYLPEAHWLFAQNVEAGGRGGDPALPVVLR